MESKRLASIVRRVKKDSQSLNVGTALMLSIEIDMMTLEELLIVRAHLASKNLTFKYLDTRIARLSA